MDSKKEERIETRAHEIWEREGRPEGEHERHWHQAAREIEEEDASSHTGATEPGSDKRGVKGAEKLTRARRSGGTAPETDSDASPRSTQGKSRGAPPK